MAYVITEACIGVRDRSCVEVCPVDCIYGVEQVMTPNGVERLPDMLFINPDECIDCDACTSECPVEAIYADVELPDSQSYYQKLAVAIFNA